METNMRIHKQLKDFILWMRGPEYTTRRIEAMKYYHSLSRRDETLLYDHAERAMWIFIADIITSDTKVVSENIVEQLKDYSMALLLHDVIEDTDITEEYLRSSGLWSDKTIELVKKLTKDNDTPRFDNIRCVKMLSDLMEMTDDVKRLKLADRSDNMDVNLGYKLKFFKKTHSEVQNFIKFVNTYSYETSMLLRHFIEFGHEHDGLDYTLSILASRINMRILGNVLEVYPDEFIEEFSMFKTFDEVHSKLSNKIKTSTNVHKNKTQVIDVFSIVFHTAVIFKQMSRTVKSNVMDMHSDINMDSVTTYIINLREYMDNIVSNNKKGYIRHSYMDTTSFILNRMLNYVENIQIISELPEVENE